MPGWPLPLGRTPPSVPGLVIPMILIPPPTRSWTFRPFPAATAWRGPHGRSLRAHGRSRRMSSSPQWRRWRTGGRGGGAGGRVPLLLRLQLNPPRRGCIIAPLLPSTCTDLTWTARPDHGDYLEAIPEAGAIGEHALQGIGERDLPGANARMARRRRPRRRGHYRQRGAAPRGRRRWRKRRRRRRRSRGGSSPQRVRGMMLWRVGSPQASSRRICCRR